MESTVLFGGEEKKNKGQIWPQLLRPTERALARDRQLVRGIVTLAGKKKKTKMALLKQSTSQAGHVTFKGCDGGVDK